MWEWDEDQEEVEETDDEPDDDEDEDAPGEEADDGLYERVEEAFRADRREIRASTDAADLRERAADLERSIRNGKMPGIAGVRARDLIEIITERLTELRARRV